jgi:hypothetical protein
MHRQEYGTSFNSGCCRAVGGSKAALVYLAAIFFRDPTGDKLHEYSSVYG